MSGLGYQPDNDTKRAAEALTMFHNEALKFPQNYAISFDELVAKLQASSHGAFMSGFGFGINQAEMSDSQVRSAMIHLADAGEGRLPAKWNDFFNALTQEATTFRFADAASATISGTVKDLGDGLKEVGDTAIQTLKNAGGLVTMLPYLAFGGLALYIYFRVKK